MIWGTSYPVAETDFINSPKRLAFDEWILYFILPFRHTFVTWNAKYYAPQPLCVSASLCMKASAFHATKICHEHSTSLLTVMMMTLRLCRYSLQMAKFVLTPIRTPQRTFHDLLLCTKRQYWMASWQRTDSIERWTIGQCYRQIQLQLQLSAKLLV